MFFLTHHLGHTAIIAILIENIQCNIVVLGGIPVHTEYRCLFFLRYEFLKYRNTGVI